MGRRDWVRSPPRESWTRVETLEIALDKGARRRGLGGSPSEGEQQHDGRREWPAHGRGVPNPSMGPEPPFVNGEKRFLPAFYGDSFF